MTSQKSSVKIKPAVSTFGFTFRSAIKDGFIVPLMAMLFTILISASPLVSLIRQSDLQSNMNKTEKIKDIYIYLLNAEPAFLLSFQQIALAASSFLLALLLFKYVTEKNAVNVIFSLGITRTNMFLAKLAAGAVMLFVMLLVPYLILAGINISTFGSSAELWRAVLYQFCGYYSSSIFTFALTAVVFSCVGTIFEGVGFSWILLSAPPIIAQCLNPLFQVFVFGSSHGQFLGPDFTMESAAKSISFLSPLTFFNQNSIKYNQLIIKGKEELTSMSYMFSSNTPGGMVTDLGKPNFTTPLLWILAAVLAGTLAVYLINRRKTEISGFLGKSKTLNFIATFIISFGAAVVALFIAATELDMPLRSGLLLSVIISILTFTAFYCVIDLVLIRNFKEFGRGFVKLPAHIGILVAILIIFATGFFGFSNRVPDIADIEKVAISPTFPSNAFVTYKSFYMFGASAAFEQGSNPVDGFKSQKDIELIQSIHREIIKEGRFAADDAKGRDKKAITANLSVVYTLKNGKQMIRYYPYISNSAAASQQKLKNTDLYAENLYKIFKEKNSNLDKKSIFTDINAMYSSEDTAIYAISSNLSDTAVLDLSSDQRSQMIDAIYTDLLNQGKNSSAPSTKDAAGVLQFAMSGMNSGLTEKAYGMNVDGVYFEGAEMSEDIYKNRVSLSGDSHTSGTIILSSDMTNTLRFIDENGLRSFFENTKTVESIEIIPLEKILEQPYNQGMFTAGSFYATWFSNEYRMKYTDVNETLILKTFTVSNTAQIEELMRLAELCLRSDDTGYLVIIKFAENSGYTTKYISYKDAPNYIK